MPEHTLISPQSPVAVPAAVNHRVPAYKQIMHLPETNFIQCKCAHCEEEEKLQRKPFIPFIQKKESTNNSTASDAVANQIQSTKDSGKAMPASTKSFMESRFGNDFSDVRIHTDSNAAELSKELNAQAFTVGNNVYFNEGKYKPESFEGKHLLAHELTHVIQQEISPHFGNNKNLIQRSANYDPAGQVNEVRNLAQEKLSTKTYGITYLVLNTTPISSSIDSNAALKKPALSFSQVKAGGIDVMVTDVPLNEATFKEDVLMAGPWAANSTKGKVGSEFPRLSATCSGNDPTTFTAKGKPSDADMHDKNRKHEDQHVKDHKAVFNNLIVPWDNKLTRAKNDATVYHGTDNAHAESLLYAAMGGKPNEIADQLAIDLAAANQRYHGSRHGGGIQWSDETANADCSVSSAKGTNPA